MISDSEKTVFKFTTNTENNTGEHTAKPTKQFAH